MKSTIIGIDLAKNVFEVYVEDEGGQGIKRCRLSRKRCCRGLRTVRRHSSAWKPVAAPTIGPGSWRS